MHTILVTDLVYNITQVYTSMPELHVCVCVCTMNFDLHRGVCLSVLSITERQTHRVDLCITRYAFTSDYLQLKISYCN